MMDATPLYEHPYDPSFPALRRDWTGPSKPRSRTSRPVRYYWVDYAHAKSTLAKTDTAEVQELRAADVYELGNTIRKVFFNVGSPSVVRFTSDADTDTHISNMTASSSCTPYSQT